MKAKREELLKILSYIKKPISSKGILEYSNHFIFQEDYLFTFNDLIGVFYPFKQDEIKGAIKIDTIFSILEKIKDEEIDLSVDDNKHLQLKGRRIKSGIPLFQMQSLDKLIDFNFAWKKLPEQFIEGIYLCSFSTAKEKGNTVFNSVCLKDIFIMSSDNYRISIFYLKKGLDHDCLISGTNAQLVYQYKDDITHYFQTGGWIYFLTKDKCVIMTRLFKGQFPDCMNFFKYPDKKKYIELPESLEENIKACSIFTTNDLNHEKKIIVQIGNNKIKLKSSSTDGWIDINLNYKTDKELKFTIHPDFFLEILKLTRNMALIDNNILFEAGSFSHLISLYKD